MKGFPGLVSLVLGIGIAVPVTASEGPPPGRDDLRLAGFHSIRSVAVDRDRIVLSACREKRLYVLILAADDKTPVVETAVGVCGEGSVVDVVKSPAPTVPLSRLPAEPTKFDKVFDKLPTGKSIAVTATPGPEPITSVVTGPLIAQQEPPPIKYGPPDPKLLLPPKFKDGSSDYPHTTNYSQQELNLFLRRSGYAHVTILVGEAPIYLAEACRKGKRWRVAIDRRGQITDTEELGPCFRKFLGVGIDDVQGALHWLVGCEPNGDGLSLYSNPSRLRIPAEPERAFAAAAPPPPLRLPSVTVAVPDAMPAGGTATELVAVPEARTEIASDARPAAAVPPPSPELWTHNGSVMTYNASDDGVAIAYAEPRAALAKVGVRKGTMLFRGHVQGNTVKGFAYVVMPRCTGMAYEMSGELTAGKKLKLSGLRPKFSEACTVTGTENETLVFEKIATQLAQK